MCVSLDHARHDVFGDPGGVDQASAAGAHNHPIPVGDSPGRGVEWVDSDHGVFHIWKMMRLEISCCQNMSLGLDLKILFFTVPAVIGLFFEGVANRLRRPDA